ncbi:MAG: YqhA family protein [bacterium]
MFKVFERIVERLLWESRHIIFLAVLSAVVSAIVLVLLGSYDVLMVIKELYSILAGDHAVPENFPVGAIVHIISAIDVYLIAVVLLIFGIGLYELFISKIDYAERETKSSRILVIHDLDQLKEKLAKVIIMVLIVTFFKHAVILKYTEALNLLYLGTGILLIAVSTYFMHKGSAAEEKKP